MITTYQPPALLFLTMGHNASLRFAGLTEKVHSVVEIDMAGVRNNEKFFWLRGELVGVLAALRECAL